MTRALAGKLAWFLEQLHTKLFWQKPGIPLSGRRLRRPTSAGSLRRAVRSWENVSLAADALPQPSAACLRQIVVSEGGKENRPPAPSELACLLSQQLPGSFHSLPYVPGGSPVKGLGLSPNASLHSISRTFSEDEEVDISSCNISCVRCVESPRPLSTCTCVQALPPPPPQPHHTLVLQMTAR